MERVLKEEDLEEIYNWVDEITLSRPKRNMARDFSDGVLMAEIIAHFNSRLVELHNYVATGAVAQKLNNWKILNDKVLRKMRLVLSQEDIAALANSVPDEIQKLLFLVRRAIMEDSQHTPTVTSKVSKVSRMTLRIGQKPKPKKVYTLKEALRVKEVAEFVEQKDRCVELLKEQVQILLLKFGKLEETVKSKDRQIEELVKRIKAKGLN